MTRLPNSDRAVIAIEKLRDYALNEEHSKGKHKARVFRSMLGINRTHAGTLAELIRATLDTAPAEQGATLEHGESWRTWHEIVGLNAQSAIVTVGWILKPNTKQTPELVTCYIDVKAQQELRKLFV